MIETYIMHRIYLQQISMLKERTCLEAAPLNFNYQNTIIVTSGLLYHAGKQFVYLTSGCGCGPQPIIWGAYFMETIPWATSQLCAFFSSSDKAKDREIAGQNLVDTIYRVCLPACNDEKTEITAVLRSHFGNNKVISFL